MKLWTGQSHVQRHKEEQQLPGWGEDPSGGGGRELTAKGMKKLFDMMEIFRHNSGGYSGVKHLPKPSNLRLIWMRFIIC